jgi:ATP-binding cassette subfamily C protein LapB
MKVVAGENPLVLEAVMTLMRLLGLRVDVHGLSHLLDESGELPVARIESALVGMGLEATWVEADLRMVPAALLPCLVNLGDKGVAIVCTSNESGPDVIYPMAGATVSLTWDEFLKDAPGRLLLVKRQGEDDQRADSLVEIRGKHWFWGVMWSLRKEFAEAVVWSVAINILTLAGTFLTMTVYDRVLPNQAYVTMWSLAIGVTVAMLFEMGARTLRAHGLDQIGKHADLVLGSVVFRHVLGQRLEQERQSIGAFANILREFESVRSFVTSMTLTSVADLPFVLLFTIVIYVLAGPLAWVAVVAVLVSIIIGVLVQIPLARLAAESMRCGATRHGVVVESLESLEALKSLRAEHLMLSRHDRVGEQLAGVSLRSTALSTLVGNVANFIQQLAMVATLLWGVYLVGQGVTSTGGIVAAVMLSSRALASVVALVNLAVRFQNAKVALSSLDRVMAQPLERDSSIRYFRGAGLPSALAIREGSFAYKAGQPEVVKKISLAIAPGERVAVLGRIGSGKSTLLKVLAGLYRPTEGDVLLGGVDIRQIEPTDVRGRIAYVSQDARLFYGSLRDNLTIGAPHASDEEILRVAAMCGVSAIAAANPEGFNLMVGEGGRTLSGGQRQAVALARTLLTRPRILLLDEPTSAMDGASEQGILSSLASLDKDITLVVVTHKPALLALVNRVVVIEQGCKVADGPKAEVLAMLSAPTQPVSSGVRVAA